LACEIFEAFVGALFMDGCCVGKVSCILETALLSELAEGTVLEGSDKGTNWCCFVCWLKATGMFFILGACKGPNTGWFCADCIRTLTST
jgi:hypothetical protein